MEWNIELIRANDPAAIYLSIQRCSHLSNVIYETILPTLLRLCVSALPCGCSEELEFELKSGRGWGLGICRWAASQARAACCGESLEC